MPGISGCSEQSIKLAAAQQEAFSKHRSITVCWLDLANAYGSVHHEFIQFSLCHYNAPNKLTCIVRNLCANLKVIIASSNWVSNPIRMLNGVYQGDPFSVVIFNTIMCTYWLTPRSICNIVVITSQEATKPCIYSSMQMMHAWSVMGLQAVKSSLNKLRNGSNGVV